MKYFNILLFSLVIFFLSTSKSYACLTKLTDQLSKDNINRSELIFRGFILGIGEKKNNMVPVVAAVSDIYKGEIQNGDQINLLILNDNTTCSIFPKEGISKIFYAEKKSDNKYYIGLQMSQAAKNEHLEELKNPSKAQ